MIDKKKKLIMEKNDREKLEIILYVVYILGGALKPVKFEDIAVKCWELAKDLFKWEYHDYPQRFVIQNTLKQNIKKRKEKDFVITEGNNFRTYTCILTRKGLQWIQDNETRIQNMLKLPVSDLSKANSDKLLKRFNLNSAFKKYKQYNTIDNVELYEVTDLIECNPDSSPSIIKKKFKAFEAKIFYLHNEELNNFCSLLKKKFEDELE